MDSSPPSQPPIYPTPYRIVMQVPKFLKPATDSPSYVVSLQNLLQPVPSQA